MWLIIGVLLVALGIASLFVPIPRQQEHGFSVGDVEFGVTTEVRDTVHPAVSAAMILLGVAGIVIGARK